MHHYFISLVSIVICVSVYIFTAALHCGGKYNVQNLHTGMSSKGLLTLVMKYSLRIIAMVNCVYFFFFYIVMITNALLLSIAINCCTCQVSDMTGSSPRSPGDLEMSTEALDDFTFGHKSFSSPQVWRQCVHQDSNNKATLLLSNCNLSNIHQRAFGEWPYIKVSKCTKGCLILSTLFVQSKLKLISLNVIFCTKE